MADRIITLTGDPGSGKSTVAKALTERWGAFYHSAGAAQREIARRRGLTILELSRLEETDSSIDREVDSFFVTLRDKPGIIVVDSRMAWHFLPESFKIRLTVEPEVAVARIGGDKGRVSEDAASGPEEVYLHMQERRKSEKKRYYEYYGVDNENNDNFDLVVDTTHRGPGDVVDLILSLTDAHFSGQRIEKFWTPKTGV